MAIINTTPNNVSAPMDESEWLVKMAYLKALEDRADEIRDELKGRAPEGLAKGTARLPSGAAVGVITRKAGYTSWSVGKSKEDKAAFKDFVAKRHGNELVMDVDPDFRRHLMGRARHEPIPGTVSKTVRPTFEVKLAENAFDDFWLERAENSDFADMLDLI